MTARTLPRHIARQLTIRGWLVLATIAIVIGSVLGFLIDA